MATEKVECPKCWGEGMFEYSEYDESECNLCNGTGEISKELRNKLW